MSELLIHLRRQFTALLLTVTVALAFSPSLFAIDAEVCVYGGTSGGVVASNLLTIKVHLLEIMSLRNLLWMERMQENYPTIYPWELL